MFNRISHNCMGSFLCEVHAHGVATQRCFGMGATVDMMPCRHWNPNWESALFQAPFSLPPHLLLELFRGKRWAGRVSGGNQQDSVHLSTSLSDIKGVDLGDAFHLEQSKQINCQSLPASSSQLYSCRSWLWHHLHCQSPYCLQLNTVTRWSLVPMLSIK